MTKYFFDNSQYNKIKNRNINFYKLDILDFKKVEQVFKKEKINLVIHLAATSSLDSLSEAEIQKSIYFIKKKQMQQLL